METQHPKNDFKRVNRINRLNFVLAVVLSLTFIGGINYLASQNYKRFDLTESRKYSLSPETRAYLRSIEQPIEIYVLIPEIEASEESRRILSDLRSLLREYHLFAATEGNRNITVHFIDVFRERLRAREILSRYSIETESSIFVVSGDQMRVIPAENLYSLRGQRAVEFRGESEFTSAILEVTNPPDEVVYFLYGQGELRLADTSALRGLSQVRQFMRERGIRFEEIDLTQRSRVPQNAALLVIPSPTNQLRGREVEMIRNYLQRESGSLLFFADPLVETGLEPLMAEWGLSLPDRIVVDNGPDYQSASGDLVIRSFGEHPITDFLRNFQITTLIGLPRPIVPAAEAAPDPANLVVRPLLLTSPTSWAESDFRPGVTISFDPNEDTPGPITVAAAAERKSARDLQMVLTGARGGRVVVIGNSDMITNERFKALGNRLLFINSLNWCLARENRLSIAPRRIQSYLIVMGEAELRSLLFWFAIPPGIFLLAGGIVFWRRR